eukprot:GHUV01001837.1.p1 GENE.GHUV01001837.1~~GHUV01001837.1.p1  ORF type:complete len:303 (+),score=84.76 GHUV01001837.1:427-1335(+)
MLGLRTRIGTREGNLQPRTVCAPAGSALRLRTDATRYIQRRQVAAGYASGGTAWQAWTDCLPKWSSSTLKLPKVNEQDRHALAAAVAEAATDFKPKPTLQVPSLDDLPEVPKNLHKRLELVARVQLAAHLDTDLNALDATITEYTTTDIAAACSVAGVIVKSGSSRTALASVVVTETERQMTWSRLEGLLLHWAVSRKAPPAEKWELPPRGWKTLPDTTVDAGGAWQTVLERHPLPMPDGTAGPAPMYTMLMSLPLEGPLAEGGLIFVLKSGSTGQNTKWLKDAGTKSDFFCDIQKFKVITK